MRCFMMLALRLPYMIMFVLLLPAVAAAQSVMLQPDQGPVGTKVTATGEGLPENALVYVFFHLDQQPLNAVPAIVNNMGEFKLDFCVPDLPSSVYPTFFTISTLPGMHSGPIFTIKPGDRVTCQSATCKPAFFIGVRGSGESDTREAQVGVDPVSGAPIYEPLNDSLGPTVGAFYDQFKATYGETNVDVHGVPYPAFWFTLELTSGDLEEVFSQLQAFGPSVADGARKLSDVLIGQQVACPDQRFVIVAYSQGAWVAGEALAGFNPALLSKIVAVVLLGDPKLWWRDPDFEGIATKCSGVPSSIGLPGGLGPRQPFYMPGMTNPSQPGSFQFRSYCAEEDPVCNATLLTLDIVEPLKPFCSSFLPDPVGTSEWFEWLMPCVNLDATVCQHMQYATGTLPREVANWFVERLGQLANIPAAPSEVSVFMSSGGFGIQVRWTDNSDNEEGFDIGYSSDPENTIVKHELVEANQTLLGSDWGLNYDQNGLLPGQTMCFQVSAYNATGNSEPTPWSCITVP